MNILENLNTLRIDESNYFGISHDQTMSYDKANQMLDDCIEEVKKIIGYNTLEFRPDYRAGYFKALLDVVNSLERCEEISKYHRFNNLKGAMSLVSCMIDNQDEFMKYGDMVQDLYLKVSPDKKKKEWVHLKDKEK